MVLPDIGSMLRKWICAEGAQSPLLLASTDAPALQKIISHASQLIACEKKADAPCGVCRGCRQALAGTYPDIVTLTAAKPPLLSMKDARAFLDKLSTQSFHGRRLAIIPDAEHLSLPAVAALLKTLEEPAQAMRFLLTTAHRRRMLATVLSRCQVVRLHHHQEGKEGIWPAFKESPDGLSPDNLAAMAHYLEQQLKAGGVRPDIFRAYMRMRDYYKITSRKGNTKLATMVLLSTLEQIKN